nr:MAG TPA: hypothetical protein [Caudoviricetes sp.]
MIPFQNIGPGCSSSRGLLLAEQNYQKLNQPLQQVNIFDQVIVNSFLLTSGLIPCRSGSTGGHIIHVQVL